MNQPASLPNPELKIGWAEADITPSGPVLLGGQMYARLSEGVLDPVTVTAWALEAGTEQAVFVGCDLSHISDELWDAVRAGLRRRRDETGLDPYSIALNATHTHTGPVIHIDSRQADHLPGGGSGANLEAMPIASYVAFAADRIVQAVVKAWMSRAEGGVSFGLGYAALGRGRRWVNADGKATMYRLTPPVYDTFRHIEGNEDHRVQVLATYDTEGALTGLVVNVPCPSQDIEEEWSISADYWCETRRELRRRFGERLFILPQCSAAGELVPRPLLEKQAYQRMLRLKNRSSRAELARRLADALEDVVPHLGAAIETAPVMRHRAAMIELPLNRLTEADVRAAEQEAASFREQWRQELSKLEERPELKEQPRWYLQLTNAYGRMHWQMQVAGRYERQRTRAEATVELHVLRLGEVMFATNPFELYLDFGMQLQLRSPAVQTFLVQLAGNGSYMPSPRSVRGGGYGSVPASNPFGTEAGQRLVDETVRAIRDLWES